ncbi:hypothetical protein BGP_1191 [Beggiatoa sp. PS]|nr:hypothetical protein BGP_1191 [Beggiatoa sp. PS]
MSESEFAEFKNLQNKVKVKTGCGWVGFNSANSQILKILIQTIKYIGLAE